MEGRMSCKIPHKCINCNCDLFIDMRGGNYKYITEHHTKIVKLGNWDKYKNGRFPTSVKFFKNVPRQKSIHPTQKPVALMEYLIKTYTNEKETVLDFTMGSGSTMVACVSTNRNGIGIEMDEKYFNIAKKRVEEKKEEKEFSLITSSRDGM